MDRNQRHAFDARADVGEFFIKPIIVSATRGDSPVFGDNSPHGQACGGINHGPIDFGFIQKVDPFSRPDIAGSRALFAAFQEVEVNMIEGRKNLRAVAGRHVLGYFVHARSIVDMAIGINDLHDYKSFRFRA